MEGQVAACQSAPFAAGDELAQRHLDDLGYLGRFSDPGGPCGNDADEGMDREVGGDRRCRLQGPDQLNQGAIDPDLLLGLAQGRLDQVCLAGVAPATGEAELTGMAPQVVAPSGEDDPYLVVDDGERDQNGGFGHPGRLEGGGVLEIQQQRAQAGDGPGCAHAIRPRATRRAPRT